MAVIAFPPELELTQTSVIALSDSIFPLAMIRRQQLCSLRESPMTCQSSMSVTIESNQGKQALRQLTRKA